MILRSVVCVSQCQPTHGSCLVRVAADCGGFDVCCASGNNGGRCEHPMLQFGCSLPTVRKVLRKRPSVLPPSVGLTEGKF